MSKFPHLRKALEDMDDLVEAIRTDDVIILTKSEGERLILVKHDALSEALDRLDLIWKGLEHFGEQEGTMERAEAWIELANLFEAPMEDR